MLSYGWSVEEAGLPLANAAKAALNEYLLTVLVHHHPHNYSEELLEAAPTPVPGVVRRAERFMIDNADEPITVSDVADHLGISMRTLQAGFRQWCSSTPSTFLWQTRLQLARDELRAAAPETDVTTIALRYGFSHLGRFAAHYRSAFGSVSWPRNLGIACTLIAASATLSSSSGTGGAQHGGAVFSVFGKIGAGYGETVTWRWAQARYGHQSPANLDPIAPIYENAPAFTVADVLLGQACATTG